jgi:hypothetical protein
MNDQNYSTELLDALPVLSALKDSGNLERRQMLAKAEKFQIQS